MKIPSFNDFNSINESDNQELLNNAQLFVQKELGMGERLNKIEAYANEHNLNYMDFAGAVIDELRRQFNA